MKIGILGGGQLGRMFIQNAINYPCEIKILDPSAEAPCAQFCDEFIQGSFKDAETVVAFGADCDVISIEIEHVSLEGIKQLEAMGKTVIPSSHVLSIIQDKGLQKNFYQNQQLATAPYYLIETSKDIDLKKIPLPFVQKTRKDGYDGKGVQIIKTEADLEKVWQVPSVIEVLCPIKKELAITVLIDQHQNIQLMPIVEMEFDEALNLVDVVKTPAKINSEVVQKIESIAFNFAKAIQEAGIYAIELFLTENDKIWINETACRVHNSGHLTIEACHSSQFDQMWRILSNQPLGDSQSHHHAAMINLIGGEGQSGKAVLKDLNKILKYDGVFVHWYGKKETRPGRKMGHITITAEDEKQLNDKIKAIKNYTEVRSE